MFMAAMVKVMGSNPLHRITALGLSLAPSRATGTPYTALVVTMFMFMSAVVEVTGSNPHRRIAVPTTAVEFMGSKPSHRVTVPTAALRRSFAPGCAVGEESSPSPAAKEAGALRMRHVRRPCNATWEQYAGATLARDVNRGSHVAATLAVDTPVASGATVGTGDYVVTVGLGTPATQRNLIMDTGSDLTWTFCANLPAASWSFTAVSCGDELCGQLPHSGSLQMCGRDDICEFGLAYGDGSATVGHLARDTLTVADTPVTNFGFGCATDSEGDFSSVDGLLGLSQGPLGLSTQTAGVFYQQFSYCLPDFSAAGGYGDLHLGPTAVPATAGAVFTPMLNTSSSLSLFYVVGLTGIRVGTTDVPVPQETPLIVDSGTVITRLTAPIYTAFRDAFQAQTENIPAAPPPTELLDTCYDLSGVQSVSVPRVWLSYRDGATVEVDPVGLLLPLTSDLSQVCLAFAGGHSDVGILGNYQQQRTRVIYDTAQHRIGFVPHNCG